MPRKDGVSRISVSLPPSLLRSFDEACRRAGFADRSKAIQLAIRSFISENQSLDNLKGRVSGVILLAYDPEVRGLERVLVEAQHEERQVISSTLHNHLDDRNCLEAVMVHGEAWKVQELAGKLGKQKGVKYLKIFSFHTTRE